MIDLPDLTIQTDYLTSSEYQQDFESDKEPPVDKLIEKKMIHKGKNLRLYKRILKFGKRGFDRPAKYDRVDINYKEVDIEIKKLVELDFQNNEEISLQLGKGEKGGLETFILAISSMKKGEIAWFEIEDIVFDKNKDRKLKGRRYFVIGLKNFLTIIDVNGDKKLFKVIVEKGRGLHRILNTDEIKGSMILRNSTFEKCFEVVNNYEITNDIIDNFQKQLENLGLIEKNFLEGIICNLKNNEQVLIQFPKDYFNKKLEIIKEEKKPFFIKDNFININNVKYETDENWYFLDIKIDGIRYLEDVFQDQSVIKKVLKNGYTTSKPEDLSKIYFDYKILVNDKEIYNTFKENVEKPEEVSLDNFYEKNKYNFCYNKEYFLSKCLQGSLQYMKKMEKAELELKNFNKLEYGFDYNKIKEFLDSENLELTQKNLEENKIKIKYSVVLYYFKEGVNSFTINTEQRINYIQRRKDKAVEFIKKSKYKKALKLFKKINHLASYGVFEEDKKAMKKFILSLHLNSSLCYWKMGNWKEMLKSSELALVEDPDNVKATYRGAFAFFKRLEFEKAINLIQKIDFRKSNELMTLMGSVRKQYKLWKKKEKKLYSNLLKQ